MPDELDQSYPLTETQIAEYRRNGYIKLAEVLSTRTLAEYAPEITRVLRAWTLKRFLAEYGIQVPDPGTAREHKDPPATSGTYARAFTQRLNLWRMSSKLERFVRSRRLARIASELMRVPGVRLYHDQGLYKEAHGGHTPWHCDQYYWPLSNPNTITVWIPLQAVSLEMGPVAFAPGSHRQSEQEVRDFAISDESEARLAELLEDAEVDNSPFALGEVSFHSGWTCHRADENRTDRTREAFTIIYMDRDIRMIEPRYAAHEHDARLWLPGVEPGEVAGSRLNPILFEESR